MPENASDKITINFVATLSPFLLLSRAAERTLPPPLDRQNVALTFSARHAIWNALKALKLAPDENILMPSYCCGSEVLPLRNYPAASKVYRVRKTMEIDVDHLLRTIDSKTRAVFVIHYIGFPQKLEEVLKICRERGLYLIEDCAHALYSRSDGRWLGTLGDIGIFSMRKTIPLPDGGAILINNPSIRLDERLVRPPIDAYFGKAKHLVSMFLRSKLAGWDFENLRFVKGTIERVKRYRKRYTGNLDFTMGRDSFDLATADYTISPLTEALLRRIDGEEVARRRRANFQWLLDRLGDEPDFQPVWTTLPPGVCPMFFPVLVPDSSAYMKAMQANGIQAIPFWSDDEESLPRDVFEETYVLKRSVLAIPLHQDIGSRQLGKIADTARRVARALGRESR